MSTTKFEGESRNLEEVFVTSGSPRFTFVKPPNYNEILLDIRREGMPVIVEGQSGTGKTTCVRQILQTLGGEAPQYLSARHARDSNTIREIANGTAEGKFVIDDFHRLSREVQEQLADRAKLAAEAYDVHLKLVLIGINQLGSSLIRLVPDIAKRTGVHTIQAGDEEVIGQLITEGANALNVEISNISEVFLESRGDYWLTQQLCQTICSMNNVLETAPTRFSLSFNIETLRARVIRSLRPAYHDIVKDFCRGVRFRPNNDPYLRLLQKVGEHDSSRVDLNELANANPDVRGSINNIKEKRLSILLQNKPNCGLYFFYNSETKAFAIEDPAVFYYIKHLNWSDLRYDCGFRPPTTHVGHDIAISFAGEHRTLAREISRQLRDLDVGVFFDEEYEAKFLGMTWTAEFQRIFGADSLLVVCLLDVNHREKLWTTFERQCFAPRVADKRVVPIYLDDTAFAGIPSDTVGISFRGEPSEEGFTKRVEEEIVMKLIERLASL